MSKGFEITIQAPVNIALIKYWGKRNEELILPLNDSISVGIDELYATTKLSIGPQIAENSIIVNGKVVDQSHAKRFNRVFQEAKKVLGRKRNSSGQPMFQSWNLKIDSQTNFPTAAGLASSAAGFAAIAFGLGKIFHLSEKEIVRLARIGSGSACRSISGGFVHWKAGIEDNDDSDCICEVISPASHWPQFWALILVVNQSQKKVGSSEAMRMTAKTSELVKTRVEEVVPKRVENLKEAILARNFPKLAEITMAESNQLHALCLDTNPPIHYLNATSHSLMDFVHKFNAHFGIRLAYTFDAGPNCCLFLEQKTISLLESAFKRSFTFDCQFPKIENVDDHPIESNWPPEDTIPEKIQLERIILSKTGTAPRIVANSADEQNCGAISVDCKML